MSTSYIDKILLKPKRYNPYSHMKPAIKDNNFYFTNCISYNMIENITKFKNKEISFTDLNLNFIGNLSFLFAKSNLRLKKTKLKEDQKTKNNQINNNKEKNITNSNKIEDLNNFQILEKYECYIPTKRMPIFNKKPLNEKVPPKKDNSKSSRKNLKEIKIPLNLNNFNFFRPAGRFLSNHPNRKKASLNSTNITDFSSEGFGSSNTLVNSNNDDGNDSSNDYSLNFGEEENNDNIFKEKSFIDLLRTSTTFPKYNELSELIECPLDEVYNKDMKYKNFIKVLDEFIDVDNYEDNLKNDNLINSIFNNSKTGNTLINIDNDKINTQRIFIINPSFYKPFIDDINDMDSSTKIPNNSSKSGKIKNFNIFSNYNNINQTSLSDDNDNDESLFSDNIEDKKKKASKKIDLKIKKILPRSSNKYMSRMNNQYIFLMYEKYKNIYKKYEQAKNFIYDELMLKKFFIQLLKIFILDIGIISKKFYDKIIKYEMQSKDKLTFEHFMNIFELILMDNNKENLRYRFLLFLKIISQSDDIDQFLMEKQINIFFDLIGCEYVYIKNFCEILGERLILRYKAIYVNNNLEKNNIEGKYIYRKIKIILDTFLDSLDL